MGFKRYALAMVSASPQESGTRARTRRAILSAAASVLAHHRNATLADIAEAADVGRSTLHRYFSDRDELVKAVAENSLKVLEESTTEAAISEGSAVEAMRRLIAAMVATGDHLLYLFGDPRVLEGFAAPSEPDCPEEPADPVIDLIRRGQAEGLFDSEFGPTWIQHTLWALVYTGCEEVGSGRMPRHRATAAVIRTFENGVHVRAATPSPG
jgi:AcrR family transcriptional regulator